MWEVTKAIRRTGSGRWGETHLNGGNGDESGCATTSSQARPGRNRRTRANEESVGVGIGGSDSLKGEERWIRERGHKGVLVLPTSIARMQMSLDTMVFFSGVYYCSEDSGDGETNAVAFLNCKISLILNVLLSLYFTFYFIHRKLLSWKMFLREYNYIKTRWISHSQFVIS